MRTVCVALLLSLALAPAASAEAPAVLSFRPPAQMVGDIATSGTWAVLYFGMEAEGAIGVSGIPASASTENLTRTTLYFDAAVGESDTPGHEDRNPGAFVAPPQFSLDFGGREGMLYLVADRIVVEASSPEASLRIPGDEPYAKALAGDSRRDSMFASGQPGRDFSLLLAATNLGGTPFQVEAEGIRRLSWSGPSVSCPNAEGNCPRGGGVFVRHASVPGGASADLVVSYLEEIRTDGGVLTGNGTFTSALVGGSLLDVTVQGEMRLPGAEWDGSCAACRDLEEGTLSLQGEIAFREVSHEGGRMSGTFAADAVAARLDESAIDPSVLWGSPVGVAATAAAALGGFFLLKFLAAALFTRTKRDPLSHPRRRKVFDFIEENPGAKFREVVRGVGFASGTVRHHLTMLGRAGLIVEHPYQSTVRFFPAGSQFEDGWERVAVLREDSLRLLHSWLTSQPPMPQKDILEAIAAEVGWSRSTTQHRLQRLVRANLVSIRLQGRLKFYSASKPTAPVSVAGPVPVPAPSG